MSIQRTLDVLVTLNTIQLRHQPMAFDPVNAGQGIRQHRRREATAYRFITPWHVLKLIGYHRGD